MRHDQAFNYFSAQQMKDIRDLIIKLTETIQSNLISMPNEDKEPNVQYSTEKRLFTGMVLKYKLNYPELSSKEVNWEQFNSLFADNAFLKSTLLCLQFILNKVDHTQKIYDAEIYKLALVDYENTRNNLESGKTTYEKKYNELKQLLLIGMEQKKN